MQEVESGVWITDIDGVEKIEKVGFENVPVDRVINVSRIKGFFSTDHIPLWDGPNTEQEDFDRAVDTVVDAIESGDRVVVHCAAGQSRSVAVLSAALATINETHPEEELQNIRDVRPFANPVPSLMQKARNYTGQEPRYIDEP